jgi:hypothetical protein
MYEYIYYMSTTTNSDENVLLLSDQTQVHINSAILPTILWNIY